MRQVLVVAIIIIPDNVLYNCVSLDGCNILGKLLIDESVVLSHLKNNVDYLII